MMAVQTPAKSQTVAGTFIFLSSSAFILFGFVLLLIVRLFSYSVAAWGVRTQGSELLCSQYTQSLHNVIAGLSSPSFISGVRPSDKLRIKSIIRGRSLSCNSLCRSGLCVFVCVYRSAGAPFGSIPRRLRNPARANSLCTRKQYRFPFGHSVSSIRFIKHAQNVPLFLPEWWPNSGRLPIAPIPFLPEFPSPTI